MSTRGSMELAWLPAPPADFRERTKGASASDLRELATCAMGSRQFDRLAKRLRAIRGAEMDIAPLEPFRLGIVSNSTTEFVSAAIEASGLRHGLAIEVFETPFNQVAQVAFGESSPLDGKDLDAVLLAIDARGLPLDCEVGNEESARATVEAAIGFLTRVAGRLSGRTRAAAILQTIAPPAELLFGSADRSIPGTPRWLCDELNASIVDWVEGSHDLLFDVASIAEGVGLNEWFDPVQWHLAKLPFSQSRVGLYAEHFARLLACVRGKTRRCLVLDLDNTLWSGVIGDDGLTGIVLGQGSAVGEAHLEVQRVALALRERGVVLAVCSKNNDEVAREVFREHPDMLLREEHIAVFQANWNDKASNLKAISRALNLGIDSLVLLDDNPAERAQVRQALPDVAVPELPEDPALYARTLLAAGYFELTSFSKEDRDRSAYYEANAQRAAVQETVGDLDEYLRSLDMVATLSAFDDAGQDRVVQLINKSNQFNLTTRRYSDPEIVEMREQSDVYTLQVRLADRFGDNGMISVVICREDGAGQDLSWTVDTWLMSCRVIGRRVEEAVLAEICRAASGAGVTRLVGWYLPTARNSLVAQHYEKLGFELSESSKDGASAWSLDVSGYSAPAVPIEIVR